VHGDRRLDPRRAPAAGPGALAARGRGGCAIRSIHHATRRYHCLGIEALRQNGVQSGGLLRHLDRCHQLIALIRARDLASARSLARLIIDDSEVLALRSFELDDAGTGRLVAQPAGSLATRVSTS
jgi:hypothetical protein